MRISPVAPSDHEYQESRQFNAIEKNNVSRTAVEEVALMKPRIAVLSVQASWPRGILSSSVPDVFEVWRWV
jgi:hypothetical protein